jgi:hypothetical protein
MLITWTGSQPFFNKNSKQIWTWIGFEFEWNSNGIWEFDLMFDKEDWGTNEFLKHRGCYNPPPLQNLVQRFRGEENLRASIGTRYLDWREGGPGSWSKGISWSPGSLSYGRQATGVYMMPCSQGWEGNIFRWWKLRSRDELQCMLRGTRHLISQKKAVGYMRIGVSIHDVEGQGRNLCKITRTCPNGDQRQKRTWSGLGTHWQCHVM